MGVSTNAEISFGILFAEDFEFPWNDEKYDNNIEEWWIDISGFVNPVDSPYDEAGEYKTGYNENSPEVDLYFENLREWRKENPLPVEKVNYCSGDYPSYILSIPDLGNLARRGYPSEIDLTKLLSVDVGKMSRILIDFCNKHDIEVPDIPRWWLSSFWG